MALDKFALTNYYSYSKNRKQKHICPECNREIKGWALTKCSNCNRFFCRSHMVPSIGENKQCPGCRQRKNMFKGSSDATLHAFRTAELSENIQNKLFASIFAGKDLFKFAQEQATDENQIEQENPEEPLPPTIEQNQPQIEEPILPETPPVPQMPQEVPQESLEQEPTAIVEPSPAEQPMAEEPINIEPVIDSLSDQIVDILKSTGINYTNITPEILDTMISTAVRTANVKSLVKTAAIIDVESFLFKDPRFQAPGFERTIILDPDIAQQVNNIGSIINQLNQVDLSKMTFEQRNNYFKNLAQFKSAHQNLTQNPASPTNILNIWQALKNLASKGEVDNSMLKAFQSAYGKYFNLP